MSLCGWPLDIEVLRSPIKGFSPIRPITAVAFIAVSAVLLWRSYRWASDLAGVAVRLVGILVALLGAAVLVQYAFEIPTFLDDLLVPDQFATADAAGNRMAPQTAFNFLSLGIALNLVGRRGLPGQICGVTTLSIFAVTYAVVLGMLYHSTQFAGYSSGNTMAVATVLSFTLIGSALLAMNAECRLFALFTNSDLGGKTARRLLPVIVLIPTVIGWLRVVGQDEGFFDTVLGTTLAMFTLVVLMFMIVVFYSLKLSGIDQDRREAEEALARSESELRGLFNYTQGMVCIHDINGILTTVNPAVIASTGYGHEELIGRNIMEFLPKEQRAASAVFFRQIEHEGISSGLLSVVAKDGRQLMWQYQSILVTEDGREPYVIGHALDVTELMTAQRELRNLSLTDELTGLLNRRGFLHLAEQLLRLERHKGTARGLNLLFADMDGLKNINDTIGHEAGSDAIKALADAVKAVVRSGDLVARWGGDEFVILTIGAQDENVDLMIERIERRLDEHNAASGKQYKVACSIGKAPVKLDGDRTFEEIIAEADEAMYAAKRRRKAREQTSLPPPSPQTSLDDLAWY